MRVWWIDDDLHFTAHEMIIILQVLRWRSKLCFFDFLFFLIFIWCTINFIHSIYIYRFLLAFFWRSCCFHWFIIVCIIKLKLTTRLITFILLRKNLFYSVKPELLKKINQTLHSTFVYFFFCKNENRFFFFFIFIF